MRPPGGFCARQSSALSFWFVDKCHNCSALCVLAHLAAALRRLMNPAFGSKATGIVSSKRSFKSFHTFSMAFKSCEHFGKSTNFKLAVFNASKASSLRKDCRGRTPSVHNYHASDQTCPPPILDRNVCPSSRPRLAHACAEHHKPASPTLSLECLAPCCNCWGQCNPRTERPCCQTSSRHERPRTSFSNAGARHRSCQNNTMCHQCMPIAPM